MAGLGIVMLELQSCHQKEMLPQQWQEAHQRRPLAFAWMLPPLV